MNVFIIIVGLILCVICTLNVIQLNDILKDVHEIHNNSYFVDAIETDTVSMNKKLKKIIELLEENKRDED